MVNFDYHTPTRLVFGQGVVEEKLVDALRPLGKRVLLAYGGGSIKRLGLYDLVKNLLADFEVFELSGIAPNPKYNPSVLDGVKICKEQHIDVLLAVGGGSVLDCCKAIAAGACYEGEPWDLISYKVKAQRALPIVDIMTLAATGSEYDRGGVISRTETNEKTGYQDDLLFPVCSFLDPTYTFTVPAKHTAAGVADAINHVMEQYFCEQANDVSDGYCETLIKVLMKYAPIAIAEPNNYEARAEIMYACTFGCNGLLANGTERGHWPMHMIEHALSAYYDITHGEGLAILTPHWMRYILNNHTIGRFVKFGKNIYGIDPSLSDKEIAEQTIQKTRAFFKSLGMPMTLGEVGIDASRVEEMAQDVATNHPLDKDPFAPLAANDIAAIITAAL